jgi:hypothetical protein
MIREPEGVLPYRRTWLLAIGRHLKAEYDAVADPVPPRLAALVKQLEMPSTAESSQKETGQPAAASTVMQAPHRSAPPTRIRSR